MKKLARLFVALCTLGLIASTPLFVGELKHMDCITYLVSGLGNDNGQLNDALHTFGYDTEMETSLYSPTFAQYYKVGLNTIFYL